MAEGKFRNTAMDEVKKWGVTEAVSASGHPPITLIAIETRRVSSGCTVGRHSSTSHLRRDRCAMYVLMAVGFPWFGELWAPQFSHGEFLYAGGVSDPTTFTLFHINPFVSVFFAIAILFPLGSGLFGTAIYPISKKRTGILMRLFDARHRNLPAKYGFDGLWREIQGNAGFFLRQI